MKALLVVLLLASGLLVAKGASYELPTVPPFQEMLDWQPKPDRTLEVTFPDVSFRYSILDWKPAPNCQAVIEDVGAKELKWVTHAGFFAHRYLTKSTPMLYKIRGEAQWYWLNLKTYEEK